jgi:hypothetical protein
MNERMKPIWQAWDISARQNYWPLLLAVALHGAFSSPAPPSIGIAEILIASLLCFAALPKLPQWLDWKFYNPQSLAWLWLCLVPFCLGLLSGHDLRDWSRDLIAIIFLGFPLFIKPLPAKFHKIFAHIVAVAGTLLALRYWLITDGFAALNNLKRGDALLYLSLDPAMLFAAIYFPIQLIEVFFSSNKNVRKILFSVLYFLAALLAWGSLAGMMMRGALALGFIALVCYGLWYWRRPGMPIIMGIVAVAVILFFYAPLSRFIAELMQKTQAVGLNARDADLAEIWKIQSENPLSFMFGQGWGATYSSPAVGGYWVNYSHSALGFYFLKSGLFGLIAAAIYLGHLFVPLRRNISGHIGIILSALPPIILAFTLYTSYKFFSCGILLLLLGSLHAHPDPQPR